MSDDLSNFICEESGEIHRKVPLEAFYEAMRRQLEKYNFQVTRSENNIKVKTYNLGEKSKEIKL